MLLKKVQFGRQNQHKSSSKPTNALSRRLFINMINDVTIVL